MKLPQPTKTATQEFPFSDGGKMILIIPATVSAEQLIEMADALARLARFFFDQVKEHS